MLANLIIETIWNQMEFSIFFINEISIYMWLVSVARDDRFVAFISISRREIQIKYQIWRHFRLFHTYTYTHTKDQHSFMFKNDSQIHVFPNKN